MFANKKVMLNVFRQGNTIKTDMFLLNFGHAGRKLLKRRQLKAATLDEDLSGTIPRTLKPI